MSLHVRDGGAWLEVEQLHVKDSGGIKEVTKAYMNDGGAWKEFFSVSVELTFIGAAYHSGTPQKPASVQDGDFLVLVSGCKSQNSTAPGAKYGDGFTAIDTGTWAWGTDGARWCVSARVVADGANEQGDSITNYTTGGAPRHVVLHFRPDKGIGGFTTGGLLSLNDPEDMTGNPDAQTVGISASERATIGILLAMADTSISSASLTGSEGGDGGGAISVYIQVETNAEAPGSPDLIADMGDEGNRNKLTSGYIEVW